MLKNIFISNLKYQTLLDSVQGRSPNLAFLPIISIPELEPVELGHSHTLSTPTTFCVIVY